MEVNSAHFLVSSSKVSQCPIADRPEYAFIGRSNVGKSSLINMLTGRKALAKVSATPGKTTLINHFVINETEEEKGWYLVDLPGYGFAKRSKSQREAWEKNLSEYLFERKNLQTIFVLIDSRIKPQDIDLNFINQLGENGIPFNIIFTKSDKNKQADTARNVKVFLKVLSKDWESLPQHFVSSSVKRTGRDKILEFIDQINKKYKEPDR